MDDSALERFFDQFIENEDNSTEGAQEEQQDSAGGSVAPPPDSSLVPGAVGIQDGVPVITNIVCSAHLGCSLDLDLIARRAWNTEYRPKTFQALTIRIRVPRTTANIYSSGSIVCSGAKSPADAHRAARRFARRLQLLGLPVRLSGFRIHNVVASFRTPPLRLEPLYRANQSHCSYEPELFPGLFLKVAPGVNATVFAQGKVNVAGSRSVEEACRAVEVLVPVLARFSRNPV